MNYRESPDGSIDILYYTRPMTDMIPSVSADRIKEIDDPLLAFWMGVGYAMTWVSLFAETGDPNILAQVSECYSRLTIWMGKNGYHTAIAYKPRPNDA